MKKEKNVEEKRKKGERNKDRTEPPEVEKIE